MNQEIVTIENNVPLADSRKVAETLGIEHGPFMTNIILKYQDEVEKDFGVILFRTSPNINGRGKPCRYALLTESQMKVYVMYSRPNKASRFGRRLLLTAFKTPNTIFSADPILFTKQKKTREMHIQRDFAAYLRSQGEIVRREVRCEAGAADVVTDSAIYEIKKSLTSKSIFEAMGQVLLYRSCINPNAQAFIVGEYTSDVDRLAPLVKRMGVVILLWQDGVCQYP